MSIKIGFKNVESFDLPKIHLSWFMILSLNLNLLHKNKKKTYLVYNNNINNNIIILKR